MKRKLLSVTSLPHIAQRQQRQLRYSLVVNTQINYEK